MKVKDWRKVLSLMTQIPGTDFGLIHRFEMSRSNEFVFYS